MRTNSSTISLNELSRMTGISVSTLKYRSDKGDFDQYVVHLKTKGYMPEAVNLAKQLVRKRKV